MDCARCGLANTPGALRCDCGFDLKQAPELMQAEWDTTLRSARLQMGLGLALAAGSVGLSLLTFLAARELGGRWFLLGGGFMAGLALFGRANVRWHQARRAREEAAGSNRD